MELKVGPEDLGTDERTWRAGGLLDDLARFDPGPAGRVVVVAPHPDDEVLGVGGLLQQLVQAGWVTEMVSVTDGEASHPRSTRITADELVERRSRERDAAYDRLGVQPARLSRLGLPDGSVAAREGQLSQALADRLEEASLCLAPWRHDGHPDHDAVGRAAAAACRDNGTVLVEYLVWAWHWTDPGSGDIPWASARRVDLSRQEQAAKRWAIRAFVTQVAALGPEAGDAAPLPAAVLARFRRPFEVVLA